MVEPIGQGHRFDHLARALLEDLDVVGQQRYRDGLVEDLVDGAPDDVALSDPEDLQIAAVHVEEPAVRVLDEGQCRRVGHERFEAMLALAQRLARVAAGGVGQRALFGDCEPHGEATAFDGLDDVVVGAGVERRFQRLGAFVGGDQQDDRVAAREVSPELAAERDAVLARQPDVHDRQVERARPGPRRKERPHRLGIGKRLRVVVPVARRGDQEGTRRGVVFDDQGSHSGPGRRSPEAHSWAGGG